MALFFGRTARSTTMTSRYTGTDSDDGPREPQPAGDQDDSGDTRHLAPELDEGEAEEAGYGYGV
jgi:hypothetical protein